MAYFEMCSQKFVGAPREMVYRDGRPGMSENPVNSIGLMVTSVSYQTGNEVLASFYNDNRNDPICQQPTFAASVKPLDAPPAYDEIEHENKGN